MHSLYIGRVVYLAAPRSLHPFFLPSLITCLRVPLISVPGFGPEIPGAGAPLGHPGPEARTPNGWSSSVDQGGSNDHMIWVLQPLYGTRAQGSSSPVFFEGRGEALFSRHNLILIRKGRRSGFSLSLDPSLASSPASASFLLAPLPVSFHRPAPLPCLLPQVSCQLCCFPCSSPWPSPNSESTAPTPSLSTCKNSLTSQRDV